MICQLFQHAHAPASPSDVGEIELDDGRGDEGEPDSDASDSRREERHREAATELAQRTNLGVTHRGDRYHRHVEGFRDSPSLYRRVTLLTPNDCEPKEIGQGPQEAPNEHSHCSIDLLKTGPEKSVRV